ncbi:MAG: DUF4349 domain-containing protein [Anaerolineae bacterium]
MSRDVRRLIGIAALLALVLTGCAAPQVAKEVSGSWDMAEPARAPIAEEGVEYEARGDEGAYSEDRANLGSAMQQMIIRTANLSVVVKETEDAVDGITNLLDSYEGYVTQSHTWYSGEDVYANMVLRVPAGSLDAFLEDLRTYVVKVEDSSITGQDVTEEYTDLQARLRNLEATEQELLVLLTEVRENRGKAEDILAIHRELTNIRGQIESLQGRKQYLERMTAMATVSLSIRPEATPKPVVQDRWTPLVTLSEAARALLSVLRVLADLAIYLVVFSPVVIIPIVILWLMVKLIKGRKARKAS